MQFSSLPINSSVQNNPRYQFSLKSENIEILPILSAAILKIAAIRSQFILVTIFYQHYLIYMPSLVEIPLAVSDISEVKYFDIRSRFPWQRWPFWKFQYLNAPLQMKIHLPVKFSKDRCKNNKSLNFVWGLNNNKKRCKNNKSTNFVWGLNNKIRCKNKISQQTSFGDLIARIAIGKQ